VRVTATSAARDAENAADFFDAVERSLGVRAELLTGDEEAELTKRGVGELGAETLLVDLGGGSTELVLDGFHTSLPMGSARFPERYGEDAAASIQAARPLLPQLQPEDAVGVAATITSIAALDLGLGEYDRERVDGHVLTRDGARAQLERLTGLTLDERRRVPGLEPERAPVIVAGAAILVAILDAYGLESIRVSERDLLDGAALAAAELPEPEEGAAPPGAYTCC